jgi:hypothetical protein
MRYPGIRCNAVGSDAAGRVGWGMGLGWWMVRKKDSPRRHEGHEDPGSTPGLRPVATPVQALRAKRIQLRRHRTGPWGTGRPFVPFVSSW